MIMIQLAIVEDEDSYAKQLSEFAQKYQKESGQYFKITRFRDGDEITNGYKGQFDIILMDIEMKLMDGMTAAEEIRKLDQDVVIMFITNMANYAIRGYQVDALDYVLKPVSYFAFSQKLGRAIGKTERAWAENKHILNGPDGRRVTECNAEHQRHNKRHRVAAQHFGLTVHYGEENGGCANIAHKLAHQ